jgi:hypothetical protein
MLTGIFINDTIKILFDGVLQSSTIIQGPLTNTSDKLYFAVDPNDVLNGINPVYFKGKLDDIGIWNRALDSTEISNLFNGGSATSNTILRYDENVKIFPNPTNDHITIDAGNLNAMNGYSIRITNSLGQQMFQSAINQQQFYLDLTTWTGNGMYYVNIIDPNGNIIDIKKIVLQ